MVKPSVCTLDCPDACSLSVVVHDGRIEEIRGSQANPYTAGVLCNKVTRHLPELIHGEGRLTTPLRRTGTKGEGRFERIGWEQALDLIHERFSAAIAEHGPQCVLPLNYAGPHGTLAGGSMDLRFFHKLGASLLDRRPMCGGVRGEAWAGTMGNVPGARPEQAAAAKLVIVWGINVTWTSLHLMPVLNEAKANGAKIVVVDPRRTKVAEQAHLHLPVRPGTDVVLAWALATELERLGAIDRAFVAEHVQGFEPFMAQARRYPPEVAAEICGVPEAHIRRLAEWYATLDPAAIALGNGLERNRNGGSGLWAIFALPALAGKFGVRGGGILFGSSMSFPKSVPRLQGDHMRPEGIRTLNILDMGRHLLDARLAPPLMGLFIYNHNAVIVHPEQNTMIAGLLREDLFTVVADVVMTDTTLYADVVLPNATNFEHDDLYPAYGHQYLQRGEAVIAPQGEALPNTEMFRRLAARDALRCLCLP
ncbi:MAG: molybdopterin-dependent oxidoreductase [SAR324 cluster bacterium]|nr:molybdopterin-dependent oxidoreductase [SAR324 cluster bacterium]